MTAPVIQPEDMLALAAAGAGLEPAALRLPETVLCCWGRGLIEKTGGELEAEAVAGWPNGHRYPVYRTSSLALAHLPMGAPMTVRALEELAAAGGRRFVTLGWMGSLQPDLPVGSLVVPTTALSEEGTSAHYGPPGPADPFLVEALNAEAARRGMQLHTGEVWTTDAMYRETRDKVDAYAARGVLGVEMETAAMLSFASFQGVKICNLLVVSDELHGVWKPGFGDPRHGAATLEALALLVSVATDLPPLSR